CDKESRTEIQLLRSQKATLIEILSGDADFVLQHADARSLLSLHGYQQVKACRIPSEKVTDLLDHIIQRGPEAAKGLLELLKEKDLQETFPRLDFIKHLQVNTSSSGRTNNKEKTSSHLVNEKQLMTVARAIGKCWREIGRSALDVSSVKLEQIEEDHSLHVERVFAMLRYWQTCQRKKATAAHLHSLLSQGEWALPSESIDFLLRTD
uniref:Death domain-containing protein n=1 Tax=Anabas testudineus TaxID=64144 RepID=A0A3Q1JQW0_ANATE